MSLYLHGFSTVHSSRGIQVLHFLNILEFFSEHVISAID
jgi:hypothetical protein